MGEAGSVMELSAQGELGMGEWRTENGTGEEFSDVGERGGVRMILDFQFQLLLQSGTRLFQGCQVPEGLLVVLLQLS